MTTLAALNDGQGFSSALTAIIWFTVNICIPLIGLYGMGKGLTLGVHRSDWGNAALTFIAGVAAAFIPPIATFLFKIDIAAMAAAKLLG
jgi:hypothetical protein